MRRNEAASWWSRLQRDDHSNIRRKFETWYADPRNAAAFKSIESSYGKAALLRLSRPGKIEEIVAARSAVAEKLGIAATIAAIAAVLFALAGHGPFGLGGTNAVMLATNIGEIRKVRLSDGSKVTLDSASSVEVIVGRGVRKARLKGGRARFELATSPEDFVIEAGKTSVSARQGVVDVEMSDTNGRVDIIAGKAVVGTKDSNDAPKIMLQENEAAAIGPQHTAEKVAPERDRSWPDGMIQFAGTPIREAVAKANLYSDQKILLEDRVGELRISGAFHVGDTQRLAQALAACFQLKITQLTNGNYILSGNTQPPSNYSGR